jgi:clusterin-associated protein 1
MSTDHVFALALSLPFSRPAFMDEYEKLEEELGRQYDVYLQRFRNLDYLEHELDVYNQSEREKLEENERTLKRMQDRLRKEELRILRGEQVSR